jgi:hypothetical protein
MTLNTKLKILIYKKLKFSKAEHVCKCVCVCVCVCV